MRGLAVQQTDSSRDGFESLFAPILPRLSQLHWVFEELPLGAFDDELCSMALDEVTSNYAPPGTLIPSCAAYIKNDWFELYGFSSKPDPDEFIRQFNQAIMVDGKLFEKLRDTMKGGFDSAFPAYRQHLKQGGGAANRFLEESTDLCIFNIDGGLWEFYAHDEALVESLSNHCATIFGLKISHQDLHSRI